MCSSLSMKTLLWFYLLVCCVAAQSFTEKSVHLGQNVTLKCEVSESDVYWYLMKPSEPPVFILRSYSRMMQTPDYKTALPAKMSRGIRLYIQNNSTENLNKCDQQFPILIRSVIMNCALAVVATVFTVLYCRTLPKPRAQPPVPAAASGRSQCCVLRGAAQGDEQTRQDK
ncbi:uncharacterized protein Hap1MRO34_004479 isoform 4-T4 [Clarias gariepinus]|uniref:uncharacterized protein LOC128519653 isoform X4 n=1 Tax=Clarias gariepinus TaxID=13013 RepID=UPI00234D0488|nr:uncharacterized protein LOC128519653 isoform X4 [Clarias gariepinus]